MRQRKRVSMTQRLRGITDEEAAGPVKDLFDAREKAVLAWSEAMTLNTAKRDDAVWAELRSIFPSL